MHDFPGYARYVLTDHENWWIWEGKVTAHRPCGQRYGLYRSSVEGAKLVRCSNRKRELEQLGEFLAAGLTGG